jgi:hypothetical protein
VRPSGAPVTPASDPLLGVFGQGSLELFRGGRFVVTHGALERFPAFMRSGPMASIDALCRHYVGPLEVANGTAEDGVQVPVSEAHAAALLKLGLTVYFTELRRSLPDSRPWLRALEASLGLPECTTVAAFSNAPGSGLGLHHDRFDQLFFQLVGKKQFRHAPNGFVTNPDVQYSPFAAALPEFGQTYRHGFLARSQAMVREQLQSVTLEPGSAFFMPAGTWHTTADQEEPSLSLVVVVRAPSRLDLLLNYLRYYASQAPEWRARAYGGFATDDAVAAPERTELTSLTRALGERLARLEVGGAFGAWSAHGYTVGSIGEYPRHLQFERYIRLPSSKVRIEPDDMSGKLSCIVESGPTSRPLARTPLAFNAPARPLVDWILATERAFTLDEAAERFPEFTRDDIADLLGWLSVAALIRPLPAPEWDEA